VAELRLEVVLLDLGGKPNLLELATLGPLLLSLLLAVQILPKINDLADDWVGLRGDFDEIEIATPGLLDRLCQGHDPQLLAVLVYDPNFASPDLLVLANAAMRSSDT
jgi:hypothetical protein